MPHHSMKVGLKFSPTYVGYEPQCSWKYSQSIGAKGEAQSEANSETYCVYFSL